MKTSFNQQVEDTVKMLVILLAEPKTSPSALAKTLNRSASWVTEMVERFRSAGMDIEYDHANHRYSIGVSNAIMQDGKYIGRLAKKLASALKSTGVLEAPATRFVSTLNQYTKAEFAEMIGVTPQNVQNMIDSRYGQGLPEGWVAFRLSEGGSWKLQRLETDRSGKNYKLPQNVETSAFEYILGGNPDLKIRGPQELEFPQCIVYNHTHKKVRGKDVETLTRCDGRILAHSVCSFHYYRSKRIPKEGFQWIKDAKAEGIDHDAIAKLQRWINQRNNKGT